MFYKNLTILMGITSEEGLVSLSYERCMFEVATTYFHSLGDIYSTMLPLVQYKKLFHFIK